MNFRSFLCAFILLLSPIVGSSAAEETPPGCGINSGDDDCYFGCLSQENVVSVSGAIENWFASQIYEIYVEAECNGVAAAACVNVGNCSNQGIGCTVTAFAARLLLGA